MEKRPNDRMTQMRRLLKMVLLKEAEESGMSTEVEAGYLANRLPRKSARVSLGPRSRQRQEKSERNDWHRIPKRRMGSLPQWGLCRYDFSNNSGNSNLIILPVAFFGMLLTNLTPPRMNL